MTEQANLAAMRVADLQSLAAELGIKGSARMRKSQLIDAITAARAGAPVETDASAATAPKADAAETAAAPAGAPEAAAEQSAAQPEPKADAEPTDTVAEPAAEGRGRRRRASAPQQTAQAPASAPDEAAAEPKADDADVERDDAKADEADADEANHQGAKRSSKSRSSKSTQARQQGEESRDGRGAPKSLDDIVLPPARDDAEDESDEQDGDDANRNDSTGGGRKRNRNRNRGKNSDRNTDDGQSASSSNGGEKSGANEKSGSNRQRDRRRDRRDDVDPEIAPDDVLLPIAGILDVLDNYAFVRTSGYLAGPNDVYVSLGQVKKYGLRKGDAIVGAIRQPREGEQQSGRQKYNALAKIDTINGAAPEQAKDRPEFDTLTPLYPDERIRLETKNGHAAQRMIDLFAPIGKGTRGLVIAPPKSGKSIMLERIANAIAHNSPDTHLMLVLVDERPEEVTRLERTIHGEVVSSTFDMPAENHTTIAELAIERAKRLVELGLDVVMLLDSITQLGRAYNLTAPVSGRIIAGGIDASAVYPPKRFFGAARKIENGGSLTILATAMVETGSRTDEVILEEFAGTGNMELRLSREIADKRIFPALDIQQSSTLHESQLLTPDELEVTWSIRRALNGDAQGVLEAVLERMSATSSNEEFLASVRANPIKADR